MIENGDRDIFLRDSIQHVYKDVVEEEIVEIPKVQTVERLLQREVEQEIEIPKYVEVEKKHVHHHRHVVEQRQKTVEVVKEKVIEKIIEKKKTLIQEKIIHVPKYVEVEKTVKVLLLSHSTLTFFLLFRFLRREASRPINIVS